MLINHIALLLDRSGSMQRLAPGVIKQYNQQAEFLTRKSETSGQKTHFSLYTFADAADQPVLVEVPLDLVTLKPLDSRTYQPNGMTAMLDSIELATKQLSQFERSTTDSFLLIVITDGDENVTYAWDKVNRIIQSKSETEKWSYIFLVPTGKKDALLRRMPAIYEGNVREWDQTDRGVEEYSRATTQGLDSYFTARTHGVRSTKGFFSNVSHVTPQHAAAVLMPVTDRFQRKSVEKECDIRAFCEFKFGKYEIGHCYYELTKREKVQAAKKLLIEDKTSGVIYGGPDARALLGFPEGAEIKVDPGNHGNWRVYVQSTSVNRKLVRGTSVLYFKA